MNSYFTQHANALRDAARRLVATPLNTLLALLVIGVALALPSAGYVALDNLRALVGSGGSRVDFPQVFADQHADLDSVLLEHER